MREYRVKRLIFSADAPKTSVSGKLSVIDSKVIFETYREHEGRLEFPLAKVLRVWVIGRPVFPAFWKMKHKILAIKFEDEFGIIQYLTFEGRNMENACNELQYMRKAEKLKVE